MAEFKHFSPIGDVTVKKIIPNFTNTDVFNPAKNIGRYEELAVSVGLGAIKGQILKNTFQFFQPNDQVAQKRLSFPAANGTTMPELGRGALGFPVYSNLIIAGDTNQDNNGKTIRKWNDIRLDAVILEISRDKNVTQTDISGRDWTVVETISNKSPMIHVYGTILADTPGVYPQADVQELMTALDSNKSLRVTSWFLAMAGIYNIVIKPNSFKQEPGSQEYQRFEFDAIAVRPVILKLKK